MSNVQKTQPEIDLGIPEAFLVSYKLVAAALPPAHPNAPPNLILLKSLSTCQHLKPVLPVPEPPATFSECLSYEPLSPELACRELARMCATG